MNPQCDNCHTYQYAPYFMVLVMTHDKEMQQWCRACLRDALEKER